MEKKKGKIMFSGKDSETTFWGVDLEVTGLAVWHFAWKVAFDVIFEEDQVESGLEVTGGLVGKKIPNTKLHICQPWFWLRSKSSKCLQKSQNYQSSLEPPYFYSKQTLVPYFEGYVSYHVVGTVWNISKWQIKFQKSSHVRIDKVKITKPYPVDVIPHNSIVKAAATASAHMWLHSKRLPS